MGQAESFVRKAEEKIETDYESVDAGEFIKELYEKAQEMAIEKKIEEKVGAREEKKLDEFVTKIAESSEKSGEKALVEAITDDVADGGCVFTALVGVFQSMQTMRGAIFENVLEKIFDREGIYFENINKKSYPDFFVFENTGEKVAFVTAKVSIRERYRQAINEKENMNRRDFDDLPFYLVTLEEKISKSSEEELKNNGVEFIGEFDYETLINELKNLG